ncbi:MAG: hypothetical protein ACK4Q5_13005 [Saprospiraceae bacterium]
MKKAFPQSALNLLKAGNNYFYPSYKHKNAMLEAILLLLALLWGLLTKPRL